MRATRLAQRDGADEALLIEPDGTVLEAPTSTLFWVDADGNLHTPELEAGVLASITRERIMRLVPVTEDENCNAQRRAGRGRGVPRVVAARGAGRLVARRARVQLPGPGDAEGRGPAGRAHPGRDHGRREPSRADEPRPHRRAAPDPGDGAGVRRPRDHPARARERPRRALRPRPREAHRRHGLPGRAGRRGVRRPQPRLHLLRADRRGDRARRLLRAHGRVRADLAGRRLDRAVGHRGAEARAPAQALLGRVARLLRADRARAPARTPPRSRRARPSATAAGRSPARRCSSRSATTRRWR